MREITIMLCGASGPKNVLVFHPLQIPSVSRCLCILNPAPGQTFDMVGAGDLSMRAVGIGRTFGTAVLGDGAGGPSGELFTSLFVESLYLQDGSEAVF